MEGGFTRKSSMLEVLCATAFFDPPPKPSPSECWVPAHKHPPFLPLLPQQQLPSSSPLALCLLVLGRQQAPPPQGPTDSNPCRDFPAVCLVEVWELWWEICKSSCMYFLPGLVAENFREPFRFLVIYFLGFENRIFRPAFSLCKSESK